MISSTNLRCYSFFVMGYGAWAVLRVRCLPVVDGDWSVWVREIAREEPSDLVIRRVSRADLLSWPWICSLSLLDLVLVTNVGR